MYMCVCTCIYVLVRVYVRAHVHVREQCADCIGNHEHELKLANHINRMIADKFPILQHSTEYSQFSHTS